MKRSGRRRGWLRTAAAVLLVLALTAGVITAAVNVGMMARERGNVFGDAEAAAAAGNSWDCILILGAGVRKDGTPSHMLEDRLKTGIALYQAGLAPKLLMSGDHGREDYDEVNTMRAYALEAGVPSEDIFMDHAGFSTYESLYRARDVFQCRSVLIVTQEYHLYRALYVAESLGLTAGGVSADLRPYAGQWMREVREVVARGKDFWYTVFKPLPKYLGEAIPITGSGEATLG